MLLIICALLVRVRSMRIDGKSTAVAQQQQPQQQWQWIQRKQQRAQIDGVSRSLSDSLYLPVNALLTFLRREEEQEVGPLLRPSRDELQVWGGGTSERVWGGWEDGGRKYLRLR